MSSEEIKTIYKKLVESYVNDYPHGKPLWMLNKHIEAYVKHEWKTKESAILDLALRNGIEIPKVKELIENGKERKEAILEVSKNMKFQVSDAEVENWIKALKKDRKATDEIKKYEEQRRQREIKEYEKSLERLTTLFSKGEISEESYKRAINTIERNIDQLRGGKEDSIAEEKKEKIVRSKSIDPYYAFPSKPTKLWYLVPFFFGLLGGLVAYIGVRDQDRDIATNLLAFSIFITIIDVILTWFFLISI